MSRDRRKILFVLRTGAHFAYHETTIDHLIRRGHQVTVLFDPEWHKQGPIQHRALEQWRARGNDVETGDAIHRSGFWRRVLFLTREARSYANYCRRGPEAEFYRERWRHYLPLRLQRLVLTPPAAWLLRRPLMERALHVPERLAPADAAIVAALRQAAPDCVVASPTNMRFDEELEYVKAARALGIPTAVPVLSWDNLTTKGLIHVQPDLLLAWHKGHQKEARTIHGVPAAHIAITGSPFFDKWFETAKPISSRTATCTRLTLDPQRPYILYLGSSANIARDESWLVIALGKALRNSRDPALSRLQVVFRPHPANLRAISALDRARVPVWPRDPGLPDTAETISDFRDMLHHAAAVVGINTTGMVDAVICDRPCVALTTTEYAATQSDTPHFQRMAQSKALYLADSVTAAAKLLGRIQGGHDPSAPARRNFTATFARPCGLGAPAGEVAAFAIERLAGGTSAEAISEAVRTEFADRPAPAPPAVEPDGELTPSALMGRTIEKARKNGVFRYYQHVRDTVLRMMDENVGYRFSSYWKQEVKGFDYMFDPSPLVIARLREHTHHITGVRAYEYRSHHAGKASPFEFKLEKLHELDTSNLFVPEAPHLGGFGHPVNGGLVNLDTLKFYECLIALDRAGVVGQLRASAERRRILEIGAGWGGFAYQVKTLFPNTTYVIVDLPPTMLFSATYLKATFPDARIGLYGETPGDELLARLDEFDFIFLPPHAFTRMTVPRVDVAINIASFQEMTTEQVVEYVQKLADAACPRLYSLNRDRSPYNDQLSTVSESIAQRYAIEQLDLLPIPYTVLTFRPSKVAEAAKMHYRHLIGRLPA